MAQDSNRLEQLRQRNVEERRVAEDQIELVGEVRRTIQIPLDKPGQVREPPVHVQHSNRALSPMQFAPEHRRAQTARAGEGVDEIRQLLQRLLVKEVLLAVMMFFEERHGAW